LETRISALKASIKEAERAGKLAEALRLCEDLRGLEKSRKGREVESGGVQ
jgi:hypothetical protein